VLIGIIDLGINNLTSVVRAFSEQISAQDSLIVLDKKHNLLQPDLVILPGLGKFEAGMKAIADKRLEDRIKKWTSTGSKIVGICLGMQMLGSTSEESPGLFGLDILKSRIEKLPVDENEKIPNIGWSEVNKSHETKYFSTLEEAGDFYFAHSYHMVPWDKKHVLTKSDYGKSKFVSSVFSENVLGLQFHPEKSGVKGRVLISEIVDWARNEN
jgi:imidazole glycerol-phosphate synthase subunit HisH